jgi:hypothetical protein
MGDLQAVGPDGKRRLPALRLGQRLGYARDRDIRTLIKSRRSDLEKAGQLICVTIPQIGPGRPAEEFFLDDVQSVLVTMWSDTPYSLDAQIEIARSPWVLTDVCKGVGIENNREVAGRLKDDEKANVSISDGDFFGNFRKRPPTCRVLRHPHHGQRTRHGREQPQGHDDPPVLRCDRGAVPSWRRLCDRFSVY